MGATDARDDTLEHAIRALIERIGRPSGGATERALARRERELGSAIPAPARRLLGSITPEDWAAFVTGVRLLPLEEVEWLTDELTGPGRWFMFASGIYGDAVVLGQGPGADLDNGPVLLADHEAGPPLVLLETTLAAWLDKLLRFRGEEYAYMMGELKNTDAHTARAFLLRHMELNPWSEWGARSLMRLDFPDGHPVGYHHWDPNARRLVPIGEDGEVDDITLDEPTQADLDSVVAAGKCRRLMICGGVIADWSTLSRLATLEELYVYDHAHVAVRSWGDLQSLSDVCFLRCGVVGLDALGRIAALRRLRLNDCRFDEAELAEVKRLKPAVGVER